MVRRRRWLIAALALGAVILTAGACAGDGQKEIDEDQSELVIPGSALEALDEYAFTSDIELSSASSHLEAGFDARFQAPDRFQGPLTASGEQYESLFAGSGSFGLELPLEAEVIAVGGQIWTREAGGAWQEADRHDG